MTGHNDSGRPRKNNRKIAINETSRRQKSDAKPTTKIEFETTAVVQKIKHTVGDGFSFISLYLSPSAAHSTNECSDFGKNRLDDTVQTQIAWIYMERVDKYKIAGPFAQRWS